MVGQSSMSNLFQSVPVLYCVFWQNGLLPGAIGSVLHFVLGPFLGALSDAIGRRPVILLLKCNTFSSELVTVS